MRSHKIRLDLNDKQASLCAQHAGYARKAWNHGLADFKEGLKIDEWRGDKTLRPRFNAVKYDLYPWCKALSHLPAKNALINLGRAIDAWVGRKRDGVVRATKTRFPRFKKRGRHDSFRIDDGRGTVVVEGKKVNLPKIGWLRMREAVRFNGEIISCTVSKIASHWFASFTVDTKTSPPKTRTGRTIGVDVGIKRLAVCSDGVEYANPKPLHAAQSRLRRFQRALARRKRGSNRWCAMRDRIARQYYRVSCIRRDAHHKATTAIVKRSAKVVCETLNVKGMLKNRRLARALSDAGLGEFIEMLRYKSEMYGVTFEQVSQWFPSSKICSQCGRKNDALTLAMRTWTCQGCGSVLDRDHNAALNLEQAERPSVIGRGRRVSRPALGPGAVADEASTQQMVM